MKLNVLALLALFLHNLEMISNQINLYVINVALELDTGYWQRFRIYRK